MSHESISWTREPKICKTSIFRKFFFFPKYDNFNIINTDSICLSIFQDLN